MSTSDRLDKWLTDSEEVLLATHDGLLDPDAFTDERAGQALAALRAVLNLHRETSAPYDTGYCEGCNQAQEFPEEWPCPTVRAVQAALGED